MNSERNAKFLWGVATSAFQLEGSPHADWASWDSILSSKPDVTNHYSLYKEDLCLLKELGVNAYRFSLEWSRIQPREKAWDNNAVAHYQDVINILLENNIEPMVTIHHFTHPLWFIKKYPWHKNESVEKFLNFVEKIVSTIKGVKYWITFNEPYVLLLGGYLEGCMPPGIKDMSLAINALKNIFICHGGAYDIIHSKIPDALVSVAHNMAALAPWNRWNPLDKLLAKVAKYFYNHSLLDAFITGTLKVKFPFKEEIDIAVPIKDKIDFFGVNYYTRIHMRFNPFKKMGIELRHRDIDGYGLTDMGWEIHPHGLEKVLRYASKLNVPLIITENGIATHDDQKKIKFMKRHVDVLEKCIKEGIDVRGYFYWSLIDNYEWLQGLDARFGLYKVDFDTLKRKPTNAAAYYSYLIKSRDFS
ncbi:glycoside hydrolase family 1 protein [Dissulfurispira sp.]|uniref:glycoside hydrolase family 1 protein n=1 Tax=Dissulfurispira sp. TaxID=2817609 RepID=UPI002FDB7919